MPYVEPTYNLTCDLHYGQGFGNVHISAVGDLVEADVPCNLAWGKRIMASTTGGTTTIGVPVSLMTILIPSDRSRPVGPTDFLGPGFVLVHGPEEVWYWVWMWDFIGAGFDNEHIGILALKCHD